VAGRLAGKPAELVAPDALIEASPAHPWVGRGALKLAHALELWPITVEGRPVLDLGASTGGFTAVCLAKGAARVFAVDVGHGQLHATLKDDLRVVNLEGTDARNLTVGAVGAPDLVVADLGFISLTKALPAALTLAAPGADLVALVKPQFEAGPRAVGKGGVVRDAAARQNALAAVRTFLEGEGWQVRATAESPILGGDGNLEFLLWTSKPYSTI
jgi:23S rRNA (cytidine1920-2'-O)/16S rRNA (cytidine1409-2'-O)-methyltransferase